MLIWKRIRCHNCGGHGLVCVYSYNEFEGAGECNTCDGRGTIAISPKDRVAKYPGGPFVGSDPGAYQDAREFW